MKLGPSLCLVTAVLFTACADEPQSPVAPVAGPALNVAGGAADVEDRHLVVFGGQSIPEDVAARVASLGGRVEQTYKAIGVATVLGLSAEAAARLQEADDVSFVEPDAIIQWVPEFPEVEVAAADLVTPHTPEAPATAFFFPRQWHLRAIGAERAWAAGRLGSPAVSVAILDTGIDYLHADLQGRVDLVRSRSFVPSDDAFLATTPFAGRHPVTDLHFHGTHVAATVTSNALAAAGVTSQLTLIGVKVLSRSGSGATSGVLAGIMYASDVGAHVINMSLGSTFNKSDFPGFIASINRAIAHANRQGATVVVSAGNANADLDHDGDSYKAYCTAPLVVCVSSTGPAVSTPGTHNGPWQDVDAKSSFSNYGRSAIDVAAPGGGNGNSFVWAACSGTSFMIPVCQTGTFVLGVKGTSMASPHTAGVAGLLAERFGRNPAQIKAGLQQSADDLGEPGTDPIYGKGRINAARAVGLN